MSSPRDRWREVRRIFEAALEVPPDRRAALLDESCGGDPSLRREVEALLDASTQEGFLDVPAAEAAARALVSEVPTGREGARVGPYRLRAFLARGGMGEVYLAERADGVFDQQVAIKLIGGSAAGPELTRRFERERSILADLNHPHIAHLLDGGTSELGPWLAMEYVHGMPLLQFARSRALGIDARVRLLRTVCEAVQYAHGKGIVHRDLKPSNVFVDFDGRVKLLDFGIAVLDTSPPGSAAPATRTHLRPLTPEYASPEQVRGDPITPVSDVYQLGILLFELLGGSRPHNFEGRSPAEIERILCDEAPPLLSRRLEARPPEHDPALLGGGSRLRGDLDHIVRRAMHPEPGRRYASAVELGADLERFLSNRPVRARPDSTAYRISRFARRHRGAVVLGGLAVGVGLAGLVATTSQARRAQERFDDTRALATTMVSELQGSLADLPGSTAVRAMLVSQALEYLQSLSEDPGSDDALLLEVADAYQQIGRLQGDPYHTNLGDFGAARESYQAAFRIRERLWRRQPDEPRFRIALASSYPDLASIADGESDLTTSAAHARAGLELLDSLAEPHEDDDGVRGLRARLRTIVGSNQVFDGALDEGLETLRGSATTLEDVLTRRPDSFETAMDLWSAYSLQVDALRFDSRFEEALGLLEARGCPLLDDVRERFPNRPAVRFALYECQDYLGTMQEQLGRPDDAEASYRQALSTAEGLIELDPANERGPEAESTVLVSLGRLLFRVRSAEAGAPPLIRALEIRRALRDGNPENLRWTGLVGSAAREVCRGYVNNVQPTDALPFCEEAVAAHRARIEGGAAGAIARVTLAYALGQSARAHRLLAEAESDPDRRAEWTSKAIELYRASASAYDEAGDFGPDAAWEIHPDSIDAELAGLLAPRITA